MQAAEQGDADKVGKKRKKSKGKAGEEELFEERGPADRAAALREAGISCHSPFKVQPPSRWVTLPYEPCCVVPCCKTQNRDHLAICAL